MDLASARRNAGLVVISWMKSGPPTVTGMGVGSRSKARLGASRQQLQEGTARLPPETRRMRMRRAGNRVWELDDHRLAACACQDHVQIRVRLERTRRGAAIDGVDLPLRRARLLHRGSRSA